MKNKNIGLMALSALGMLASWGVMLFQSYVGDRQMDAAIDEKIDEALAKRFGETDEKEEPLTRALPV